METAHTWESLRRATLRRQFPDIRGTDRAALLSLVEQVGPIQSQAARAPFLTASSRVPGVGNEIVSSAYESFELVRSTSLRGTVHTSLRHQHTWLDALSRHTLANLWRRALKLSTGEVSRLRARLDELTVDEWRTHADLHTEAVRWLTTQGLADSVTAAQAEAGSALFRGHSALLRRPLTGGWHQQGLAGYRASSVVLGDAPVDADEALVHLVRTHLSSFGPVTRRDVAWWTGDGLRRVDLAVRRLGDEVVSRPGPGGLDFLDLAEPPAGASGEPGVRLLPEYDGLLLGYAPRGRTRFADQRVIDFAWNRANGVHSPIVLAAGKLRGTWRLVPAGRISRLRVTMLPGERALSEGAFDEQAAAVSSALALEVDGVEVTSPAG